MTRVAVLTPEQAADLVETGDTVAISGCVWSIVPERILCALEQRFLETGSPSELVEMHLHVYGLGPGVGLEHFAHRGMTRRVVGGSFAPPYWFKDSRMAGLVHANEIEAFILPAGVISSLWRETGAGRPGVLTRIGWGTFVDPRNGGGAITLAARQSAYRTAEVVSIGDDEWLFYRAIPVDVSFIRATSADLDGNLTFEDEPVYQSVVAQALATKASGGKVVAQVKQLAERGTLDPRLVRVPSFLVDAVVVVPEQRQFEYGVHEDSPAFTGGLRLPVAPLEPRPLTAEQWVAWRAVREIQPGQVVNIGAGLPVLEIPYVLRASGLAEHINLSVEHGSLGGVNLGGQLCQTHWNPTAIIDSNDTFDIYTGGGLDVAFLGMAQVDAAGNVNVAKVGDSVAGVGGFMDIAQSARKVVFCGTFRQGGLDVDVSDGVVRIIRDGRNAKFVAAFETVSFNAEWARRTGQEVLYVTERAVFRLTDAGLTLTEIAPGIDVDRDIRSRAECSFAVDPDLRPITVEIPEVLHV